MISYTLKNVKMIIEEQIAQIHGMSLVLRHEVSEDNIIEEYKLLLIIANIIQKILEKEFIKWLKLDRYIEINVFQI